MTRSIRITSGRSRVAASTRLLAVGRLARDLDPLLQREEGAQPLTDDGVVVDDPGRGSAQPSPSLRLTSCPRRAPERISSVPPIRRARSSIEVSPSRRDRARGRLRVEPDAVVLDLEQQPAVLAVEPDGEPARLGVLERVLERLLGDPEQLAVAHLVGRGARRRTTSSIWWRPSRRSSSTCLRSAPQSPSRSRSAGRSSKTSDAELVERLLREPGQLRDLVARRRGVAVEQRPRRLGAQHSPNSFWPPSRAGRARAGSARPRSRARASPRAGARS